MLQAIRSKASSVVVKILFGILIIAFGAGIWGTAGDIFRGRNSGNTVATVGNRSIGIQELNLAVRQDAERWRQMLRGANLDAEQMKQLGIVDSALQRLIARDLVDLEIGNLRIAVGDDAIDQMIRNNPSFHDQSGAYDPQRYLQYVASQHMTPSQFKASLREDLVRQQLNQALIGGITPPPGLVDTLYRTRAEKRTAEVLALPQSIAPDPGTPSDTDAEAYYRDHEDEFRLPELRSFTLALLMLDDVAARVKVSDDKLREEYQSRITEFHTPEQRRFEQILLESEAKAKEAAAALAEGKDFAQVAKEFADAAPDSLDLGFFKKEDLPPQLADAAFALKAGATSEPIQDPLGWHILRLMEVKPEETESFEVAREKLAQEVARDMAGDRIAKLAGQVEDALAGGATVDDVAQRFGLKVSKIENVDANGNTIDGKPIELPVSGADILKTAFSTPAGQTSSLNDLGESGSYVLQVDHITPAAVKPIEEVKARVIQGWQQEKRDAALAALAKEAADAVNSGQKLGELAAQRKLQTFTTEPLPRSGGNSVPPALVANIFGAKPGTAVFAKGNDGYLVAQVKEVLAPDPAKEEPELARFSERVLTPAMREDLLQEFDKALRARYPVNIDAAAVARAF
jgi:peptidyl-prolyl cis-trans isomerase D